MYINIQPTKKNIKADAGWLQHLKQMLLWLKVNKLKIMAAA